MKRFLAGVAATVAATFLVVVPSALGDVTELVPGQTMRPSQSSSTSGNGGNTNSATSKTNIFSPSSYVDYKRLGGEPTVIVDRYPFPGSSTAPAAQCPPGQTRCFKDIAYYSAPLGLGMFSFFWKSDDLGKTWRLPFQEPVIGRAVLQGPGGGDSHQAVGEVTHKVFFADLAGPCETMNVSDDLGETWRYDPLGCGAAPGLIDDRQWVETDETFPATAAQGGNVYVSFIWITDLSGESGVFPTLSLVRSQHDGGEGTFATDSLCNTLTLLVPPSGPAADDLPTACPDPQDEEIWVAGPVVADTEGTATRPASHRLYIPFIRAGSFSGGPPWRLYVAISEDGGTTWTRHLVANRGLRNPANLFPQLTIDRGGNLYYTWSETRGPDQDEDGSLAGEQDVYYAFSQFTGPNGSLTGESPPTAATTTWSPPIPLTQERGDSAVFPWMVAGDAGQVDIVYYKSNSALNSNVEGGQIWNTYFGQSQNALNTGSNFKSVQISDHPIHVGSVSTGGLGGEANRNLLDFLTVDVDHLGAAVVAWADDNNSRHDTRNKAARQISGNSVYSNQTIGLQQTWPIRDHRVSDPAGDVRNSDSLPTATACPNMDVLSTATSRSGDLLTVSMTLGAPPSAAIAVTCSGAQTTGAMWGAEFWAASEATGQFGGGPNANFYVAYRDNPGDAGAPTPGVEAGRVDAFAATLSSNEFHRETAGTLGGNCGTIVLGVFVPSSNAPCTLTMTASLSGLGIKPGAGLYSITGGAFYMFGTEEPPPFLRVPLGFSNQADVTAALDHTGTGTTK